MSFWKVALTDQSSRGVPLATLQQITAALQQQVDNDFGPAWGVGADISALASGDPVPGNTWPIKIVDDIGGVASLTSYFRPFTTRMQPGRWISAVL